MSIIKSVFKRFSTLTWLYQTFIASLGSWLFEKNILTWMSDPTLRRQLPLQFRVFAVYCKLLSGLNRNIVFGAEPLLRIIIWVSRVIGSAPTAMINTGTYKAVLNLWDPYFVKIPFELTDPEESPAYLKFFISEGDTFIDVGANHGVFSIVASRLVGEDGHIIAIEPQPSQAANVRKALALNNCLSYHVHEVACSNIISTATLYVPTSFSGRAGLYSSFSACAPHQAIEVPTTTFDKLMASEHVQGSVFIKLDIEGSELAFLRGGQETIVRLKPAIMLEINEESSIAAGENFDELIAELNVLGYSEYSELDDLSQRRKLTTIEKRLRNVVVLPPV